MRRIDIQELILRILEEDEKLSFISNYQMYLIHKHLLQENLFSDFGSSALFRMMSEYPDDIKVSVKGIEIVHIEHFHVALDNNLRFSKSKKSKELMGKVWQVVKDK